MMMKRFSEILTRKTRTSLSSDNSEGTIVGPSVTHGTASNVGLYHRNEDVVVGLMNLAEFFDRNVERKESDTSLFDYNDLFYAAVFDGHGGRECSYFLSQQLHLEIVKVIQDSKFDDFDSLSSSETLFAQAFLNCDKRFELEYPNNNTGSCATVSLVYKNSFITAWVGDCRAVLCAGDVTVQVSNDHRADNQEERDRILTNGGSIEYGRLGGILSPTRVFGDIDLKKSMPSGVLTVEPSIICFSINEENCPSSQYFLLMATDGIWDTFSNQEACAIVSKALKYNNNPVKAAKRLVDEAAKRGQEDDMSCCIVLWDNSTKRRKSSSVLKKATE